MADPQAALLTQLKNIQAKTGHTIPQLHEQVAATGLAKAGERRSWLMAQFKLGYGDANTVALLMGKPLPAGLAGGAGAAAPAATPADAGDPLDAIYAGPKAALRPLHEALMQRIEAFGAPFEVATKKNYVSLRRSKQFAMIGPATQDRIEIGLNCKTLPAHARLKALPPGGMCQATTRIGSVDAIDAELVGWLREAFDAAA